MGNPTRWLLVILAVALAATACDSSGGDEPPGDPTADPSENGTEVVNQSTGTLARIREDGVLRVCALRDNVPISYEREDGTIAGFQNAELRLMAEALAVDVEFTATPFESIIAGVQAGRCHVATGGLTPKPERALAVTFSKPDLVSVMVLAVAASETRTTIEEFNSPDLTFCIWEGSFSEVIYDKFFSEAQAILVQDPQTCFLEVQSGRADAFANDNIATSNYVAEHSQVKMVLDDGRLATLPGALMIPLNDLEFKAWIDIFVQDLINLGVYEQIWLDEVGSEVKLEQLQLQRAGL